jgi:hypothetical protein
MPELCIITTACMDLLVIVWQFFIIKKLCIAVKIIDESVLRYIIISFLFFPIVFMIKQIIKGDATKDIVMTVLISILFCSLLYVIILLVQRDKYFIVNCRRICKR